MSIKINSSELMELLEIIPEQQNIMLMGKHGIGKSQILEKYFTAKGQKVVSLFLGQMSDPGDLIGLLNKNEKTGKTEFMPPYWFPTDGKPVVLFLDELNRARPEVLQTIMDLTLNKTLAGKSLPEGSRIISAVNNGEEYQLTDLDPALVSRFNVYEFVPSVSEWLLWAEKSGIDSRIINFISENPDYLDGLKLRKEDMEMEKSPDRRGWERVSAIIKNVEEPEEIHKKAIAGVLGLPATTVFFENIKKDSRLFGKDILLGDFESNLNQLKNLKTPDFVILNDEIFRFLQNQTYNQNQTELVVKNLDLYFDFIYSSKKAEVLGQFANCVTNGTYETATAFISEHLPTLAEKLIEFISKL